MHSACLPSVISFSCSRVSETLYRRRLALASRIRSRTAGRVVEVGRSRTFVLLSEMYSYYCVERTVTCRNRTGHCTYAVRASLFWFLIAFFFLSIDNKPQNIERQGIVAFSLEHGSVPRTSQTVVEERKKFCPTQTKREEMGNFGHGQRQVRTIGSSEKGPKLRDLGL